MLQLAMTDPRSVLPENHVIHPKIPPNTKPSWHVFKASSFQKLLLDKYNKSLITLTEED